MDKDTRGIMHHILVESTRGKSVRGLREYMGGEQNLNLRDVFTPIIQFLESFSSGNMNSDEQLELFQSLIDTKLIEYLNEEFRRVAEQLIAEGYASVSESAFKTDTEDQLAQKDTADIKVKASTPETTKGAAPQVSTPGLNGQQAHSLADIPLPSGAVTATGHDTFPDSDGAAKSNPAKVPGAVGNTAPGHETKDSKESGGGLKVGNSLYQVDDPDKSKGDYQGSKVGQVKESRKHGRK